MSVGVYIAVYRPRSSDACHWALFFQGEEGHIFEVVGEHPEFQYHHLEANPDSSRHHKENILVGYVKESDMAGIHEAMPNMKIDNDNPGWSCQDWVLESLEELCNEFILDADDEDYARGVRRAKKKYFGPM